MSDHLDRGSIEQSGLVTPLLHGLESGGYQQRVTAGYFQFLYGTVLSTNATVTTAAGTFGNAVKVSYVIDYGESEGTDPSGQPWGTFVSNTVGHVYYVPHVGPELMEFEMTLAAARNDIVVLEVGTANQNRQAWFAER